MSSPSQFFHLETKDRLSRLGLRGFWRINHLTDLEASLKQVTLAPDSRLEIDGSELQQIDTASAMILLKTLGSVVQEVQLSHFKPEHEHILQLVQSNLKEPWPLRHEEKLGLLARVGKANIDLLKVLGNLCSFVGESTLVLLKTLLKPATLRFREFVVQLELVGVAAIPIVSLVTFLIGVVVAYLFGIQIEKYGGNIFIVDASGQAMCRELSPILVAIIVAGRSGSAFTAQIGTMKLNEELDAMLTMGLSPLRVLLVPRVLALVVAMPLLVFVGDVMGILGSMLIADLRLGITGITFLERLHTVLPLKSFFVGLFKAPFFALFIAIIGCWMGLSVENNARSVGLNTTATVVRSIVAVILLNAAFAIIFVELGI